MTPLYSFRWLNFQKATENESAHADLTSMRPLSKRAESFQLAHAPRWHIRVFRLVSARSDQQHLHSH